MLFLKAIYFKLRKNISLPISFTSQFNFRAKQIQLNKKKGNLPKRNEKIAWLFIRYNTVIKLFLQYNYFHNTKTNP